jgi:uncharacterized protein (TIGR03066 family)
MTVMRCVVAISFILGLTGYRAAADEKKERPEADKLIGLWVVSGSKDSRLGKEWEFMKDGKLVVTSSGTLPVKANFEYKFDGKSLTMKNELGMEVKATVKTLTDEKLVVVATHPDAPDKPETVELKKKSK